MTLVWITLTRGVMAIVLGLALALHKDRAPAAADHRGRDRGRDRRFRTRGGRRNSVLALDSRHRDLPHGHRPPPGRLRARRPVGSALASRSAARNPGARTGDDTDPDVGPQRFRIDMACKRMGAPWRRRAGI